MDSKLNHRTIRCTAEESARLTNAWKRAEGITNCSQYIKAAVNAYAGEKIFELKECKA